MSSLSIYQKHEVMAAAQKLTQASVHLELAMTSDAIDELTDAEIMDNAQKDIQKTIEWLNKLIEE